MFFSRRKPQLLGALSALLFGGQTVQAITLDLGDAGKHASLTTWSDLLLGFVSPQTLK